MGVVAAFLAGVATLVGVFAGALVSLVAAFVGVLAGVFAGAFLSSPLGVFGSAGLATSR